MSSSSKLYPPLRQVQKYSEEISKFELNAPKLADKTISQMITFQRENFEKTVLSKVLLSRGIDLTTPEGKAWKKELDHCVTQDTIMCLILSKWQYSKQVYTFSKDFYEILAEMDEFQIEMSIFKYLPFEAFYIEVEESSEIEGILVRFVPESMEIAYCVLYKELDEKGSNLSKIGFFYDLQETFQSFYKRHEAMTKRNSKEREQLEAFRKILVFTMQASMYLCASNADIAENEYQKQVYRPGQRVKNKYSEIRKWDVGMRVVKERKKQEAECLQQDDVSGNPIRERQRPRMHWRKAHWHTYLTGPGKTKRELRFIAPILVNDIADELPVVKRTN